MCWEEGGGGGGLRQTDRQAAVVHVCVNRSIANAEMDRIIKNTWIERMVGTRQVETNCFGA